MLLERLANPIQHSPYPGPARELVLPDRKYSIAFLSQRPSYAQATPHVCPNLLAPIPGVRFRQRAIAVRASMPEAAVDKYDESLLQKDEIWTSFQVRMQSPPRNSPAYETES